MEDPAQALVFIWFWLAYAAYVVASFKTGHSRYVHMKPEDIPKFELDTSKIEEFGISLIVAFIVSVALALVVNPESWDAIFFGLMNTVSASYPLIYWILLKEKKKNS